MFGVTYRYFFIVLLAVYSYLNILFTVGKDFIGLPVSHTQLFGVLFVEVFLLWEINRIIDRYIHKLSILTRRKIHPLIIFFVLSMIAVAIISIITLLLFDATTNNFSFHFDQLKLLSAFGFRVNLFLHCINAIVFYMNQLKRTQLESERFKQKSIEAQFEALRNQINPHFLFNSFNALSSLVYKDADTASKFIAQLSNVYRYLLYTQEKKVVTLQEEVEFIEAYLYLLRIRFGDNLIAENNIVMAIDKYLAPATLQMLIENAIKHNVVSRKNPLRIRLFSENGKIVVINNLQEKQVKEHSTQLGLKNIQSRYGFLSDEKVSIEKTATEFIVKVPLIELEDL